MKDYMNFTIIEHKPKTVIVEVTSKQHGDKLGIIRWFGRWRQYTFFPEVATTFSKGCLEQIIDYIKELKK